MPVEVLDQSPQRVAVGGDEHDQARPEVGHERVGPVRQGPRQHVGQALAHGDDLGRQVGVPRIVGHVVLAAPLDGRRRHVEGAPPHLDLLGPVLRRGLLLVLAGQTAVVPLVQSPRSPYRDPGPAAALQRQGRGADRTDLQRRVDDVGQHAGVGEQLAGPLGLGLAGGRQVGVPPAREQVGVVPGRAAVAQQHEGRRHGRRAYARTLVAPKLRTCGARGHLLDDRRRRRVWRRRR